MSLVECQKAVALMIRRPGVFVGESLAPILQTLELDGTEQRQLEKIAEDNQVVKYGKKLRRFRLSDTIDELELLLDFIDFKLAERIWNDYFEPDAVDVSNWDLSRSFLRFLSENKSARDVLESLAPPVTVDFVAFWYVQLCMEQLNLRDDHVPQGSLLRHSGVRLVTVQYDVAKLMRKLINSKSQVRVDRVQRLSSPIHFAFIQAQDGSYRVFQVDEELRCFLSGQLMDPPLKTDLPSCYSKLVEMELCSVVM